MSAEQNRERLANEYLDFAYGDARMDVKPGDIVNHVVGLPGYEKRFPHTVASIDLWHDRIALEDSDITFHLNGETREYPFTTRIELQEE